MPVWRVYLLCGLLVTQLACTRNSEVQGEVSEPALTPVISPASDFTQPPRVGWVLAALAGTSDAPTRALPDTFMRVEGQLVALDKNFLHVPFVLLPTLVESTVSPEPLMWMSTSLVTFQEVNGALQLVEDVRGQQGHTTTRTPQILATFPIIRHTTREIFFDFQAGALADLFLARSPWENATQANRTLLSTPPWTYMSGSYIRSSSAGADWFSLLQVVSFSNAHIDIGTVFRFTFWLADRSTMPPLRDEPDDDIGYFNIETFRPGNPEPVYIARRWRTDRPLTLYLSANTPQRYRATIREGALAWNTMFDREFLQVADAPAGVTAGDPAYPLIQWIEHASGLGIGMSQSHPVTGEQLTALITVREGWATLSDTDHFSTPDAEPPALPFTLNGFVSAVQCENESMGWDHGWLESAHGGLDRATKDRLALAQLRAVVMHEVGHVLGLRHNFAGSLDTAIDPADEPADLAAAVDGTRAADAPLPSSSIMDYLTTPDDIRMTTPGRYDAQAIAWAYDIAKDPTTETGESLAREELASVHYCTDEDTARIADCARRDSSIEPLAWWGRELEALAHAYSQWLLAHVVVSPDQMDPRTPEDETKAWLHKRIYRALETLVGYTYPTAKSWVLHDQFLVERVPHAKALLKKYFFHGNTGPSQPIDFGDTAIEIRPPEEQYSLALHPFVRSPLKEKIQELERLATGNGPLAAWAAQVLHNLASELAKIGGIFIPVAQATPASLH